MENIPSNGEITPKDIKLDNRWILKNICDSNQISNIYMGNKT